jgi:ATP-dependent 26S proteasome regulatory subunit
MMAQAIASEIGALFISLSSSTIGNAFGGEEGATKLVHMVFTVAKEKSYSPVVIYLDDCHEFFLGKSKKGGDADAKASMQRFQKDLLIYKNQALKNQDRVLVIGCTSRPDLADVKLLRWRGTKGKPDKQGFFERSLYYPRANHIDRSMIWQKYVQRKIATCDSRENTKRIDYDTLALLSNGFSAGEIVSIVDAVLSIDRLKNMSSEPLVENDFTCYLSTQRKPNDECFLSFTRQITDLDSRWKALKLPPQSAPSNNKK